MNSPSHTIAFTDREYSAVLESAPGRWWRAFIDLSYSTGIRVGEALRLHHSDVDFSAKSVRICSDIVEGEVTLRQMMPAHRERVIPVGESTIDLLASLRDDRPKNTHVFVPDWMISKLWTQIMSGEPLKAEQMCPGMGPWFQKIQRSARYCLAKSDGVPLEDIVWPRRCVGALRVTGIVKLSEKMAPRALAEYLGHPSARSVLKYYDLATSQNRGWRP